MAYIQSYGCFSKEIYALKSIVSSLKAFDRVDKKNLALKLHDLGMDGNILRAIISCISRRHTRIVFGTALSDLYTPEEGVPQGGIIIPDPMEPLIFRLPRLSNGPLRMSCLCGRPGSHDSYVLIP